MWKARLEQGNIQVVYYRHGAASIHPYPLPPGVVPMGPQGVPLSPNVPPYPGDLQNPSAPPNYAKPPPYAAVA